MIRRSFLLPTEFDIVVNLQTAKTFGIEARQGCSPSSTRRSTGADPETIGSKAASREIFSKSIGRGLLWVRRRTQGRPPLLRRAEDDG